MSCVKVCVWFSPVQYVSQREKQKLFPKDLFEDVQVYVYTCIMYMTPCLYTDMWTCTLYMVWFLWLKKLYHCGCYFSKPLWLKYMYSYVITYDFMYWEFNFVPSMSGYSKGDTHWGTCTWCHHRRPWYVISIQVSYVPRVTVCFFWCRALYYDYSQTAWVLESTQKCRKKAFSDHK